MEWSLVAAVLTTLIIASTAHEHHGNLNSNHKAYSNHKATSFSGHSKASSDDLGVTDQFIQDKVKSIFTQQNNTELIQFLTAMNTIDGQAAVKHLGVDPSVVSKLLQLLRGSPQDAAKAKAQIQTLMQTFSSVKERKIASHVREVFKVYQVYLVRAAAQQQVQQASADTLKTVITALAKSEAGRGFRSINFNDLLQTLTSKGQQGRQEVADKLVAWIAVATVEDLQRASKVVYVAFAKPDGTTMAPPVGNWTTAHPSGNATTSHPSGNFTTAHPSGNFTTAHPSGNNTTSHPSGNFTTSFPSGNFTTQAPPVNQTTTAARPEPLKTKPTPR